MWKNKLCVGEAFRNENASHDVNCVTDNHIFVEKNPEIAALQTSRVSKPRVSYNRKEREKNVKAKS